jgi:hypothetical protein
MADTAKRFYGPALLSNAAATKYTVPSGAIDILRSIHVTNTGGADATLTISIGTDAAGTRIVDALNIKTHDTVELNVFIPLSASEIIQAFSGTNNVLNLTLSGVEIS